MENFDARNGPTTVTPNCSTCKPEPLPRMRRRCKSETLEAHRINKRPPFFNPDKLSAFNTNNDSHFQKNSNTLENRAKSPKKYYQHDISAYSNKNCVHKEKPKSSSPCRSFDNSLYTVEHRHMCKGYDKNGYSANNSYKQYVDNKQAFINCHPKLFQENFTSKLEEKFKEETYRKFCHDVDALRGNLPYFKHTDAQQKNLENYIKRSLLQASKYKEKVEKLNENSSFKSNFSHQSPKQNSANLDNVFIKTCFRSEKSGNNQTQNYSPSKISTEGPFNLQTIAALKGICDPNNIFFFNSIDDDLLPNSTTRRRIRARSESDSTSQVVRERCSPICNNTMIKRTHEFSPKLCHFRKDDFTHKSPKKDLSFTPEIGCNVPMQGMTDNILKDLRQACKHKNDSLKNSPAKKNELMGNSHIQISKSQRSSAKNHKIPFSPTPTTITTLADDEQECGMEMSDGLGSDSEAGCSDSDDDDDNNETSYTIDSLNDLDHCSDVISQGDTLIGCPFTPSLFPNVPPSICFADHSAKVATMPLNVYRILKWKLTNITPIVVRKTLLNSGFRLLRNTNDWMGIWGKHMKSPCFRTLRSHQKINHFPGTFQIGRKDRLWRNMHKCIIKFGKREFGFIPRTFVLPQDLKLLRQSWEHYSQLEEKWIIKPPASARGTGIRVIHRWSQIPKRKPTVVQKYIARPLLINGSKFDLRLYVLVTSMHPLRIYLYPEGLARFASVKYNDDPTYLNDRYMHLTNYSINKLSTTYKTNEDAKACDGHKWTLTSLWKYLADQGINVHGLRKTLADLVIRTIVSGESTIQVLSRLNMSSRYNCYELFGIDVLLDAELKPWLLEVNISPSLHSASPLDLHVKGPLVKALFNTALYKIPPKLSESEQQKILKEFKLEGPLCFDKRLYCTSLSRQEKDKHLEYTALDKRSIYLYSILEDLTPDDVRHLIQAEDELMHCAPLERIFPTSSTHHYLQYFESPRYYNRLFDAWEHKYAKKRNEGIALLKRLCADNVHLDVPTHSSVSNFSGAGGCRAPSPLLVRWERCSRRGFRPPRIFRTCVNSPNQHSRFKSKRHGRANWSNMH